MGGKGDWHDFPPDTADSVEKAFNAVAANVHFSISGKAYTIRFAEMKQYSDADPSRVRLVRRVDTRSREDGDGGGEKRGLREARAVEVSASEAEPSESVPKRLKGAL